jgi:hypothetical protein
VPARLEIDARDRVSSWSQCGKQHQRHHSTALKLLWVHWLS